DRAMAHLVRQGEREGDPALHGAQLGELADVLQEDPHRHRLDVDGPDRVEMVHDGIEHGPLVRRTGGEVVLERHGRSALVGLPGPAELAPAGRTGPSLSHRWRAAPLRGW